MKKKKNEGLAAVQKRAEILKEKHKVPRAVAMKLVGQENQGKKITPQLIKKYKDEFEASKKKKAKNQALIKEVRKTKGRVEGTYTEYLLDQILQELKKQNK
jgi:hypothetical protein